MPGDVPYVGTFIGGCDVIKANIQRRSPFDTVWITNEGHCFSDRPYQPWLMIQTKLKPRYVGGTTFSIEASERSALAAIAESWTELSRIRQVDGETRADDPMLMWYHAREDLWKTPEGKQLARELMTRETHATNTWVTEPSEFAANGWATRVTRTTGITELDTIDFPLAAVVDHPRPPAEEVRPPARRRVDDDAGGGDADDGPTECMICMDAPANTMVLPCMHVVVCSGCSAQLSANPNTARTCTRCLQPITEILVE